MAARWSASARPSPSRAAPAARAAAGAERSPQTGVRSAPTYDRKDRYHQRAKREGFRSRAAYKLDEIQRKQKLLRPGQRVVDLGCWPGGWLQVAAAAVGASGRVVGVDLAALEPGLESANVISFQGDFTQPSVIAAILEALGGPADVLLSDAAPKLTGVRDSDRANEEALLEAVERALPALLRTGGDALVKLLEGPEAQAVGKRLRACFREARSLKPAASRPGTSERYLLARSYLGSPKRGKQAASDSV